MQVSIKKIVEEIQEVEIVKGKRYDFQKDKEVFEELKKFILNETEFVASGCYHTKTKSFFAYKQGGSNGCITTHITLLDQYHNRYTFKVGWGSNDTGVVLIVDKKGSDDDWP